MSLDSQLNFYESVALLAVGTTFLLGLGWLTGTFNDASDFKEASIGSFAFFTVAAYVVGFLLQALGAKLSDAYWRIWGGQPTDWVLKGKGRLLGPQREQEVLAKAKTTAESDLADWRTTTSLIAKEAKRRKDNRIERFLGNYGMARGIAAGTILLLAFQLNASDWQPSLEGWILAAVLVLALMRMHSSGLDYAREIFRMYLSPPDGA